MKLNFFKRKKELPQSEFNSMLIPVQINDLDKKMNDAADVLGITEKRYNELVDIAVSEKHKHADLITATIEACKKAKVTHANEVWMITKIIVDSYHLSKNPFDNLFKLK